ncbi:MAG: DEDD exonuclease domain-containing protein [Candidatus Nanopelagicales bacterium]|nr:DEDD exonuclease domain-containing protein [Candidatus Nanopelagicales bacterium]
MHVQLATDDLGTPLSEVTFVVVDLETTGGSPRQAAITEIGAVKVRGGQVLGEFATLVNPMVEIPPFIAALTGITDALVAAAPTLPAVLPGLLEFIGDAVVVAHNAPFDVGFLTHACTAQGLQWPRPVVVDTARLARVALHRDEVANCKLGTLAAYFRAPVTPTHRALDDARATVAVLHGLIERVANLGVSTLDDVRAFTSRVTSQQREKRHLAKGLPTGPGVYIFRDAQGTALYVGTSKNIQARVRNYFTASESRRRMSEMVAIATEVSPIVCASVLEARIRELRLIASEQPRYNVRSKRPASQSWIVLTDERAPRLSVVRAPKRDDQPAFGPFSGRAAAQDALEALAWVFHLRTCTSRLASARTRASASSASPMGCARFDLGRCAAPCREPIEAYQPAVDQALAAMSGDLRVVHASISQHMRDLAAHDRYEEAAVWRDRLADLLAVSIRSHRLGQLRVLDEVVAAVPTDPGGWEIHVLRRGGLAAAGTVGPGIDPRPVVDALVAAADAAPAGVLAEETAAIADWLDQPGVRLVRSSASLSMPLHCGGGLIAALATARRAAHAGVLATDASATAGRPTGPPLAMITRIRG